LLLEDSPVQRKSLEAVLTRRGFLVVT